MAQIKVADLRPNPYRNLKHYPIDPNKIDALVRSIRSTGFWDNLVVRPSPDYRGEYELAYGHHRWKALLKVKLDKVELPVRHLDNSMMAKMMAHENMEEWGTSAAIEQETVRAIVEAFGKGDIELPEANHQAGSIRIAPHFALLKDMPQPEDEGSQKLRELDVRKNGYNIESLAEFLNWDPKKVGIAINALALIERGVAKPETFSGLGTSQANSVAKEAGRILRTTNDPSRARAVARGLSAGFRKGSGSAKKVVDDSSRRHTKDVTIQSARREADRMAGTGLTKFVEKKLPNFEVFVDGVANQCGWFFEKKRPQWVAILKYRDEMPASNKRKLVNSLQRLIDEAQKYITKLEDK